MRAVLEVLAPGVLSGVRFAAVGAPAPVVARLTALGAAEADAPHVLVAAADDLRASIDALWSAVRDTAVEHWIPDDREGGKVVLVGPVGPPGAALSNLARSLGTEWARYGIRVTAIVGGEPGAVAELVAFLASPAGDYYSGCTFSLTS